MPRIAGYIEVHELDQMPDSEWSSSSYPSSGVFRFDGKIAFVDQGNSTVSIVSGLAIPLLSGPPEYERDGMPMENVHKLVDQIINGMRR